MTSLLPGSSSALTGAGDRLDARHRRPLVLVAALGGVAAASATLLVCLAVGVVGWFLSDAGTHGTPRGGLRVGALGWLMAHGSGVHVDGVAVTVVPLGITALVAWTIWRLAHRVGDSVSGHGPDADRIADGERDWTVLVATTVFTVGYLVVTILTLRLAGGADVGLAGGRVVGWALLLCLTAGFAGIATGSGRAAIWAAYLPAAARAAGALALRMLGGYLLLSTALFLAALVVDFDTAVNVMSRLHTDAGDATTYTALCLTLVPNAAVFAGSYLLGPGFLVGTGTLVSPSVVSVGPLPMFPLFAALPDNGPTPGWAPYLLALPLLLAAVVAARHQRRNPTLRWDEGALRGCAGGVLAGVLLGLVTAVAGGAVGPGRMRDFGPETFDVLVHAITSFGIGGLLGGLAMTWWQRRASRAASLDSEA
ncbi:DUF6350 family protein [Nocardioides caricicola]|uniref:DUF6350 family protein n=1 Tax=Nocardioides caricicola TaxID=634770 RepID=A0ABW0N1Y9_9ACTN